MNNLVFFRETAGLTRKELATLMNVTVYTYQGYEEGRMIMLHEAKALLSKIYGVRMDEIDCEQSKISPKVVQNLVDLSNLPQNERFSKLIYNLIGKKQNKVGYKQIEAIIKELRVGKNN